MINLSEISKNLTPEEFRVLYELSISDKSEIKKKDIEKATNINSRKLGETLCSLIEKGFIQRIRTRINGKFSEGVFYEVVEILEETSRELPVYRTLSHSAQKPQCGKKKEKVRQKERNLQLSAHAHAHAHVSEKDVYKLVIETQNDLLKTSRTFLFANMIKICDIESNLAKFSPNLANAIRDFIAYRRSILTSGKKLSQSSLFNIFENIENAKKTLNDEQLISNIYTAISNKWLMPFMDAKMRRFVSFKSKFKKQTQTAETKQYTQKELAEMVISQDSIDFFSKNRDGVIESKAVTPCGKRIVVDFSKKQIITKG